jgi:hypothetical protein
MTGGSGTKTPQSGKKSLDVSTNNSSSPTPSTE